MPIEKTTPYQPDVDLEQAALKLGSQTIDDLYARTLVKQTFSRYESWRDQNHDWRWNEHDSLYFGQVDVKTWPGTKTKRSHLSVPMVLDHIETAIPAIEQNLFGSDEWFGVEAEKSGGTVEEARGVQSALTYALSHSRYDEYGRTGEMEVGHAAKEVILYGNGGGALEWDATLKHPVFRHVDLRDVYIDPTTRSPLVDDSRAVIERKFFTIDEIEEYRGDERMNVPERAVLMYMANSRPSRVADQTKQAQEALRRVHYAPGPEDHSPLPADRRIECLIYTSKTRIIWVLNQEWTMYNEKNPYGFIPYVFAPCIDVPNRFYAMSYADVLQGSQLYTQAMVNAHIDEIHLALIPPRAFGAGTQGNQAKMRWEPGATQMVTSAKDDIVVQYPQNATQNVFQVLSYIETTAEKHTGLNGVTAGIPRPGNANRTLGGMQMQAQGGANRLSQIVKHIEDYLIVPMLYKMYRMIQRHTEPSDKIPGVDPQGGYIEVGADSFLTPCRFRMTAARKMMSREKVAAVFPQISQFLLNGQILSEIHRVGKTVDFNEMLQMLQDATGIERRYKLIRPLTQEEQQALNQPDPKVAAEMQKAQMEQQTRIQMGQMKAEGERYKVDKEAEADLAETEERSAREMLKLIYAELSSGAEVDAARMKAEIQVALGQQKLAQEQQKHQLKMRQMLEETRLGLATRGAEAEQDLAINSVKGEQAAEQAKLQMAFKGAEAKQKLAVSGATARQKLDHNEKLGRQKLELQKETAKMLARKPRGGAGSGRTAKK